MAVSVQDPTSNPKGFFGRLKDLVRPKAYAPPQPEQLSLEEILLLTNLSETQRKAIILGAVKRGFTDKPEYLAFALEEMQKDENIGVYACAKFAVEYGMRAKAVQIYIANDLYGEAIDTLLDLGETDTALGLFSHLPRSKGFFSEGRLYEKTAKLAAAQNNGRDVKRLFELALLAYREDSKFEEEAKLAEELNMPNRAIAAYLAGAEKDTHNVIFWYKNAARVTKDSGDAAAANDYLRQAANALIDDKILNSMYAEDILQLGEEIDDPAIIQKAYELRQDYVNAGVTAEKRREDIDGAIANYLKANRIDLAAECALSHNFPEKAVTIYRKREMLSEGLQVALEHSLITEAKEIAKTILGGYGFKINAYKTLVELSEPEEAARLSQEAEIYFAQRGEFKEAAEFSQNPVYLTLAREGRNTNKSVQ